MTTKNGSPPSQTEGARVTSAPCGSIQSPPDAPTSEGLSGWGETRVLPRLWDFSCARTNGHAVSVLQEVTERGPLRDSTFGPVLHP